MSPRLFRLIDSAELERIQQADETLRSNRSTQTTNDTPALHSSTIAGLKTWAAKLKAAPADQRFNFTTAQILWRAVTRANHYWCTPHLLSVPHNLDLVPAATTELARAAQQGSVSLRANQTGDVQAPPWNTVICVEDELNRFVQGAVARGCQTELAHLVMLLWADESLNQIVDIAGMRERIDLAFDGLESRWEGYEAAWFSSRSKTDQWSPGHRLAVVQDIWHEADVEGETVAGGVITKDQATTQMATATKT
ncbi:hypothetical protein LTR86_003942 [Recurvomyces mirabilis]|nr:hypothetical protein LTR86_003942 [Recurvomyces mirabilis]